MYTVHCLKYFTECEYVTRQGTKKYMDDCKESL